MLGKPAMSLLVTIAVVCTGNAPSHAEGILSGAAQEARTPDPVPVREEPPPKKRKRRHDPNDDHEEDLSDAAFNAAFLLTLGGVLWVVVPPADEQIGYFSAYPYQHDFGYMLTGDDWSEMGRTVSVRASVDYGSDFQELSKVGTKLLVEGTSRWGLDMQWDEYFENVPSGTDQLSIGDINLTWRSRQRYNRQFRLGMGMNFLEDQSGTETGFNFTTAWDFYLAKPWVWSTELDLGRVGTADLFHFRSTLGLQWHHLETFAGFEHRNLEGIKLNGFVSGARFWF